MRVKGKQPSYLQGRPRLQLLFCSTAIVLLASFYLYSNLLLDGTNPSLQQGLLLASMNESPTTSSTVSFSSIHARDGDVMDNDKIHIVFSTGCSAFQDCTSEFRSSFSILSSIFPFFGPLTRAFFFYHKRAIVRRVPSDMESATNRTCYADRFGLCGCRGRTFRAIDV
jgi:hypothetical protein